MGRDVLIIENQPVGPDSQLSGYLENAAVSIIRRSSWSSVNPERLLCHRDGLIVVNAVPKTEEALRCFAWLQGHVLQVPTFAVVPPEDAGFVRLAAESVDDFLLWPPHQEELRHRVSRLLGPLSDNLEEVQRTFLGQMGLEKLVGRDPAFLNALSRVQMFGPSEAPVLITGETGTGKELCARLIHMLSRRRNGPFIPVECGAVPEHLFENEIFGHVRGAFTDARSEQKGLAALARHGTLFLDEIDSLSPAVQGKLLRLLQEQTFRPLGSDSICRADVRVVAATNLDLPALVQEKRFRSDLFFRLDVLRLHLPSLRERPTDIAILARHFGEEICAESGIARRTLSPASLRKLEAHDWPGNVRELYNAMCRAVLSSAGSAILPAHLDLGSQNTSGDSPLDEQALQDQDVGLYSLARHDSEDFRSSKMRAIQCFEKHYVQRLLKEFDGNITRAAAQAGKDRRSFGRLAKKYDLARLRPPVGQ
jgi:DNA-binding NtrC family response regulator